MLEELFIKEFRYFHRRFFFYIGLPLLMWGLLYITFAAMIPIALLNAYGLYKSFLLLEDYLFLRKIVREHKADTLTSFIDNYYDKTKSKLTNSRTMVNKPKAYNRYGVVSKECTEKYEMNLIVKIKSILKSIEVEETDTDYGTLDDDYKFDF